MYMGKVRLIQAEQLGSLVKEEGEAEGRGNTAAKRQL